MDTSGVHYDALPPTRLAAYSVVGHAHRHVQTTRAGSLVALPHSDKTATIKGTLHYRGRAAWTSHGHHYAVVAIRMGIAQCNGGSSTRVGLRGRSMLRIFFYRLYLIWIEKLLSWQG